MDKSPALSGAGVGAGSDAGGAPAPTAPPVRTLGVKKVTVASAGCPVSAVTVYNDRAEVTRSVSAFLDGVGQFDLTVEGLSQLVVADSLRVTSQSAAIKILEVSYRELQAPSVDSSAVQTLQERIERLEKEMARVTRSVDIVEGGVKLLDSFATSTLVRRDAVPASAAPSTGALDLDFVERVLDLRVTRLEAAATSVQDLHRQLAGMNKELAAARLELRAAQGADRRRTPEKAATISVECAGAGSVDLLLTYMVEGSASWSPSYDLRIDTKTSTLNVTYYGNIKQNSGEDWNEARLTLSTAAPSVGGVPPTLPSRRFVVGYRRSVEAEECDRLERRGSDRALSVCFDGTDESDGAGSLGTPGAGAGAGAGSTGAPKRALAAFVIEHLATIESDNKPHKVTIAVLPLAATFRHYCVPRMAPMAYVLAVCTNSTRFTLLGSKEANVFLDGAFVAKSALPNVSSGETFRSFLGVDVAVRVEYSDVGPKSSSSGVFSKSAVVAHKYSTTIKNTKPTPIFLLVADVFPSSSDARIKVLPVEPSASAIEDGTAAELAVQQGAFLDLAVGEPKAGVASAGPDARPLVFREVVARNPVSNNLVWSKRIPANTTVALPFEFRVEAPPGVQYSLV